MAPAVLSAAREALKNILKILQPVIPFLAAELWERLGFGKEVEFIRESFPELRPFDEKAAAKFQLELDTKRKIEDAGKNKIELDVTVKRIDSITRQLSNPGFIANAKPEKIAEYKKTLSELEEKKRILKNG